MGRKSRGRESPKVKVSRIKQCLSVPVYQWQYLFESADVLCMRRTKLITILENIRAHLTTVQVVG